MEIKEEHQEQKFDHDDQLMGQILKHQSFVEQQKKHIEVTVTRSHDLRRS